MSHIPPCTLGNRRDKPVEDWLDDAAAKIEAAASKQPLDTEPVTMTSLTAELLASDLRSAGRQIRVLRETLRNLRLEMSR